MKGIAYPAGQFVDTDAETFRDLSAKNGCFLAQIRDILSGETGCTGTAYERAGFTCVC